jgi:hypothetical protein
VIPQAMTMLRAPPPANSRNSSRRTDPDDRSGDPGHKSLTFIAGMSEDDAYFYTMPHVEISPQGPIFVLPASVMANSAPDLGIAMRPIKGRWVKIVDAWSSDVNYPDDVEQRKGTLMDWRHLTASSALWHTYDHDCCPTGGSYYVRLKLHGARLEFVTLRVSKHGLPE